MPLSIEVKAIGILLIVLGIVAGVWRAYDWAYDKGVQADELVWQQRELSQAQQVAANIKQQEDDARAREAANSVAMAATNDNLRKGLNDAQHKNDILVAKLHDGTLRLRDPGHIDQPASCDGGAGQVATGSGGSDGTSGTQLSTEASDFLLSLSNEADNAVRQLTACQQIIVDDRKLCGQVGEPIQ